MYVYVLCALLVCLTSEVLSFFLDGWFKSKHEAMIIMTITRDPGKCNTEAYHSDSMKSSCCFKMLHMGTCHKILLVL